MYRSARAGEVVLDSGLVRQTLRVSGVARIRAADLGAQRHVRAVTLE